MRKSLSSGDCDEEGNWKTEIKFTRRSTSQPTSLTTEGLEWDHSADLGVLGGTPSQRSKQDGTTGRSRSVADSNKMSTPASSPAALASLQYSPVLSSSRSLMSLAEKEDWRKSALGNWQTEGVTKSEIEYERRKASGCSSSFTDSSRHLTTSSSSNKLTTTTSSSATDTDSDVPTDVVLRLFQKKFPGYQVKQNQEVPKNSTCSLDPDMILSLVEKDYLSSSAKYDLIKTARGHQVSKVWNEIAELEQLNKDLIKYVKKKKIYVSKQCPPPSNVPKTSTTTTSSSKTSSKKSKTHSEPISLQKSDTLSFQARKTASESVSCRDMPSSSTPLKQVDPSKTSSQGLPKSSIAIGTDSPPLSRKQRESLIREIVRECIRGNFLQNSGSSNASDQTNKTTDTIVEEVNHESIKKPPVGFFVPINSPNPHSCEDVKPVQEYLKENNPRIYENIKKRDDFIVTIKRDREAHNEALIKYVMECGLPPEEMMDYFRQIQSHRDDKQRFQTFYKSCTEGNKENVNIGHVISTKEMKERTRRLQRQDSTSQNRLKQEEEERRKRISRQLQRNFSVNLRKYQKKAGVNIPDRLKLGPRQIF